MSYSATLGKATLQRSRFVFLGVLALLLATTSSAIVLGTKTGEFDTYVTIPLFETAKSVQRAFAPNPVPVKQTLPSSYSALSSEATPTATPSPTLVKRQTKTVVPTSRPIATPYPTFDQEAWFRQAQEENRQKSLQSKQDLEQFKRESEQRLEEFRRQSEKGLQDFINQNSQ